ncbi:MAG: class I SAM-dependent methyltransferase [Chloroflexi bacterium]|nr:class I SAM-dependent methyltransferase [Chloroflexota bacterium]MDA1227217.1 class I SAM-dependent methyltransferase [Chloroflexota bacterium]
MSESCPLCNNGSTSVLHRGGRDSGFRDFFHCETCDLVFVPRTQLLTPEGQKDRYLQHNNDVDDPDYRLFLGRLYYQLKPHLMTGAKGLEYGSGPGPALVAMMQEDGFDVDMYDFYFHADEAVFNKTYDFITCTETAEHFSDPALEFQQLAAMLRSPGWMGLMTGMLADWSQFPIWYYHRDPTHVNFFSRKTMSWIARKHDWEVSFPTENVALFFNPQGL